MTERFEAAWAAWNGARAVAFSGWTGGALAALDYAGVARARRPVPVEHVHGDAAGDHAPRRDGRCSSTAAATTCACRSRTSRRKVERAPAAGGVARAHRRPHRLRRASGSPRSAATHGRLPARGLRARARRLAGTAGGPARSATPASTRSTRRRRSRPARAACSSPRDADLLALRARVPRLRQARLRRRGPELPHERVHRRARPRADRAPGRDRRLEERRRARAARPGPPRPARAARRHGRPACTSTSCSTRSSGRPARSTTSPATASWAPATTCRTRTGSPSTTGACRCTTARSRRSA